MSALLPLAIGIGLAVSLLLTELFGIAAGGMIVPGYIALSLTRPLDVLLTVGAGFVTFLIVHTLSSFVIVYGRRRTVLMILIGYLMGLFARWATSGVVVDGSALTVIGFIIPGLIAIWLDRQGVVETLAALLTASALVRLILVVLVGTELRG
ncbi:MAG: poly-gamma-glutamate biosynthesis protein PgsC [Sorangiineae bacterium]|nr:poly-gamma-glutamate biosynthesis protein PgsC [Polyangiaceae bacterium]MEB2321039.1 poly-gamma-glutamate biosynthesis protein PgsC [Sorangiineae bacterium]